MKDFKIAPLVKNYGDFTRLAQFCLVVKLHREGSAPADCPAGFFLNIYGQIMIKVICSSLKYINNILPQPGFCI